MLTLQIMLTLDTLRDAFPTVLARFGATVVGVHSGCPNPATQSWKIVAEFSHPTGLGILSAWQQGGCCDIDFVPEASTQGVFFHGEFASDAALLEFVASTLHSLLPPAAPALPRTA